MNNILNKSFFFKLIYPNKFYREYMDRLPIELKRKIEFAKSMKDLTGEYIMVNDIDMINDQLLISEEDYHKLPKTIQAQLKLIYPNLDNKDYKYTPIKETMLYNQIETFKYNFLKIPITNITDVNEFFAELFTIPPQFKSKINLIYSLNSDYLYLKIDLDIDLSHLDDYSMTSIRAVYSEEQAILDEKDIENQPIQGRTMYLDYDMYSMFELWQGGSPEYLSVPTIQTIDAEEYYKVFYTENVLKVS